jgi:hypothetical protein
MKFLMKLEERLSCFSDIIDKATYLDICCPQFCNNMHALHLDFFFFMGKENIIHIATSWSCMIGS